MCDGNHVHHHHDHPHVAAPPRRGLKLAIAGKGGVGKTTLAGLLARAFALDGHRVLAVDADPDANLASALGIPAELAATLQPLSRMRDLARERTGASDGFGSMFALNPAVDDLPDRFAVEHAGVRLLRMGTVEQAGAGCVCPEHTLVKRLVKHLLLDRSDVVVMDMEAGIEHLGRGTAEAVDALIVVVEPGQRSVQTAHTIRALAAALRIRDVLVVGSKVRDEADRRFIAQAVAGLPVLGFVSASEALRHCDRNGTAAFDVPGPHRDEALAILRALEATLAIRGGVPASSS